MTPEVRRKHSHASLHVQQPQQPHLQPEPKHKCGLQLPCSKCLRTGRCSPWFPPQLHERKSTTTSLLKAADWLISDSLAALKHKIVFLGLTAKKLVYPVSLLAHSKEESIRFVVSNVASSDLFALSNRGFSSVISVSCAFSPTVCPQGAAGLFGLLLKTKSSHCTLNPQEASGSAITGK